MNSSEFTIGVAGCGSMGLPMALQLKDAGFKVYGFDVRPLREFGSAAGIMTDDPRELKQLDVLFSVVRDVGQTLALCFDEQGVFNASRYPRVLVISSTLSPRFLMTCVYVYPTM